MTHADHQAVLLALPRASWDVLARTTDPAIRRALEGLVQIDTCVHAAVRMVDGTVSVHHDAAEAVAAEWLADDDPKTDAQAASVPVGLERHEGSCGR
jgi:hypothetical protein